MSSESLARAKELWTTRKACLGSCGARHRHKLSQRRASLDPLRLRGIGGPVGDNTRSTEKIIPHNSRQQASILYCAGMARSDLHAPAAVFGLQESKAGRRRPRFRGSIEAVRRLSWILGVAALAVGCKDKAPAAAEPGDSPAAQAPSPSEQKKPAAPEAQPQNAEKNPQLDPEKAGQADPNNNEPAPTDADPASNKAQEPSEDKAPQVEPEPTDAPVDKGMSGKAMLARVVSLKSSDATALKYLAKAQEQETTAKQRALAANARGEKLFSSPARADRFFAWAQDHYTKHPLPPYNRAKLAAIRGEIDEVKRHLKTVKERRGRKLLNKVGFDPTFALVHDDPEVRSLIRSATRRR